MTFDAWTYPVDRYYYSWYGMAMADVSNQLQPRRDRDVTRPEIDDHDHDGGPVDQPSGRR